MKSSNVVSTRMPNIWLQKACIIFFKIPCTPCTLPPSRFSRTVISDFLYNLVMYFYIPKDISLCGFELYKWTYTVKILLLLAVYSSSCIAKGHHVVECRTHPFPSLLCTFPVSLRGTFVLSGFSCMCNMSLNALLHMQVFF